MTEENQENFTVQLFKHKSDAMILTHRGKGVFIFAYCTKEGVKTYNVSRSHLQDIKKQIDILLAATAHIINFDLWGETK